MISPEPHARLMLQLDREAVHVEIDEALLLVEPIKEWVQSDYERMVRKAKEEQVQAALLRRQRDKAQKTVSKGFFEQLGERVLDNLALSITNVHVRYEDDFTTPQRPFAVGLTLGKLTALTRSNDSDSSGSSAAQEAQGGSRAAADGAVHKAVEVHTLAIYWDSEGNAADWFGGVDVSEPAVLARFVSYIAAASEAAAAAGTVGGGNEGSDIPILDSPAMAEVPRRPRSASSGSPVSKYLLAPLSAAMELVMAKDGGQGGGGEQSVERPLFELSVELREIYVELYEDQCARMPSPSHCDARMAGCACHMGLTFIDAARTRAHVHTCTRAHAHTRTCAHAHTRASTTHMCTTQLHVHTRQEPSAYTYTHQVPVYHDRPGLHGLVRALVPVP